MWQNADMVQRRVQDEAPALDYISKCAAYKVDPEAANALGRAFERTIGTIEKFDCMAYNIDPTDRELFTGRGKGYQLKETEDVEKGERRARYQNHRADWWARTEATLSLMAKLKKRGKGQRLQEEMARTGRKLAYSMPAQGKDATPTA